MTYYPDHMNQFYVNPSDPDSARWGPTVWDNGTAVRYTGNCWATTDAMAIGYEVRGDFTHPRVSGGFQCTGTERPTPPRVRYWSGQHASAGTVADMVEAAKHWRADMTPLYGIPLEEVRHRVKDLHQMVVVSTDYGYIKDVWSCQPSFDEGHSILIRDIAMHDFGGKGGYGHVLGVQESDPLCRTIRWIPWAQMAKAAESFTRVPGHAIALATHTQEDVMSLFNYARDRVADLPRGTALRDEPDGQVVAKLAVAAKAIPLLGSTKNRSWWTMGFTRVNGEAVNRPLWVANAALRNPRVIPPLDCSAVRTEERAKCATSTAQAVDAARTDERSKMEPIIAQRTAAAEGGRTRAEAAFGSLRTKVVAHLTAADEDADAFLADVADDVIPQQ